MEPSSGGAAATSHISQPAEAADTLTTSPINGPAESPAPANEASGKRFAELVKRQRELHEKEQAVKELEGRLNPIQQAIQEAKKNPLKLLEAAGISYEELTEYILSGAEEGDEQPSSPVEKKVAELELKLKAQEEAEERKRQEAYEQQITQFKQNIGEAAAAYELVSALEQQDLVYDVILEHHATTGNVLPIDQALQLTEAYLEEQSKKILSVKKFQTSTQASPLAAEQKKPAMSPQSFTLSQSAVPSPAVSASAGPGGESKKLTREQLLERATATLRFK